MRDPQLIGFIFLLSTTVVAAYFYLKRAQRRAPVTGTDETASADSRSASPWSTAADNQRSGQTGTPSTAAVEQPPSGTERGT